MTQKDEPRRAVHRVTLRIDADVWAALARRADYNRRTRNAEVEIILRDAVALPIDRIRHPIEASREL